MKVLLNRFLALFFAIMVSSTVMAQSAEEYFKKGQEYYQNKNYSEAIGWYRKAAEQGYADAQDKLGVCYQYGRGVSKDLSEAVNWYRKASEQGYAEAQNNLGYCYGKGIGVEKNLNEAAKWYRKAADQGYAIAQNNMGIYYANGYGVVKNLKEAVNWYRKAAEQGHANAQINLGGCYEKGNGVSKDLTEAVKWYRKAAESGNAKGQSNLGICYANGYGVTKNMSEAVNWFRLAAEQGNATAQYNLGYCYEKGNGLTQDFSEAVNWYRKSAEQGYALAQNNLGVCYKNGKGVTKDLTEAVNWYRKAAEHGSVTALFNLGLSYEQGNGVSKDLTEAVKWYRKAAEQGNTDAEVALERINKDGKDVPSSNKVTNNMVQQPTPQQETTKIDANLPKPEDCFRKGVECYKNKNYNEAVEWYRKAAEQGYVDAQNELGFCYEYALGVPQNINEAVNWYRRAAESGNAMAQFNLGRSYQNGAGVTLNYNEAVNWYRKAADQGLSDAQHNMGICYSNGLGVPQDFKEAVKWYRKAAKQGQTVSQNNLGICYLNGYGVDKNYTEAFSCFKKGAEQGDITAQYNMGHCYENGFGVTKNITEAVKWYKKSAEQGYASAKQALERINNTDGNIGTQSESQLVMTEIDTDIPEVEVANDNTFVVIFANEKYQEVAPVEYALNDGETFKKYCKSVLGIPEKNIHMRKNATKNNMITELSWMKKVADTYSGEAKFIVYYAGHGIPNEKSNAAYLLPVDGLANDPETAYSMTTFYQKLGNLNAAHVTVFMDACFSGAQRGEGMLASARGVVITPRTEAPVGKMVVFSAAQGDETAYPYKEMGHGLFTYYLLKKLRETKGNCTLQELGDYIQMNVKRQSIVVNSKSQTPTVSASQNLATSWKNMKLR